MKGQTPLPPSFKLTAPQTGIIRGVALQKDETGLVRRIRGKVFVPGAKTPAEAAGGFLSRNATQLGLSAALRELTPTRSVASLTGSHLTYEQTYAGLPVFEGRLSVHVGRDLSVRLVNQDLISIRRQANVVPPGDPANPIRIALSAVAATAGPVGSPAARAGIFVADGVPRTGWKITFQTRSPAGDWEVIVDVQSRRAVSVRNIAKYANGTGMVFEPNPVQTSGTASLADGDDADAAVLNDERVSRTLQELDGSGRLTGTYATTAPTTTQARADEPTLSFNYTRNDDRFEEVMCYHWITESELYIQSLGFTNINNRQIGVDVNGIPDDNSFYSPSTKNLTFGTGGVDDAEDADIIWHEFGHSIQDNQVPGWGNTLEGGAMGEGFGDYWAASHHAAIGGPMSPGWDPFVGAWDAVSYNPGSPAFLRRIDGVKHYPEDIVGQVHADGEIWSACLWQVQALVGRTRSDTVILESHFMVSPDGNFEDGANAILAANEDLYAGADQAAIRQIFEDRGILDPPPPPTFTISGTVSDGVGGVNGTAVTAAAPGTLTTEGSSSPGIDIPDFGQTEDFVSIVPSHTITSVKLAIDISHTWIGDLIVTLVHPDSTQVILHNRSGGSADNLVTSYPDLTTPAQSLSAFNGKPTNGDWTLRISDNAGSDFGTLNSWTLTLGYAGTVIRNTTTAADGTYSFTGLLAETYRITPTKSGLSFTPAFRNVSVGPDRPAVNFTGSAAPVAPSGLTATAASSTRINLAWTDNSSNENGFRIERKQGAGAFALLTSVGANVTTFANTGLSPNTAYTYRVRAYRGTDHSAYSNQAGTTTPALLVAPSALTATAASSTEINLAWTDNSSDETSFQIERKTTGAFAQIASVGANVTAFANTGLPPNTAYTYRVRGLRSTENSAYSNEAGAITLPLPAAPSGLTATAATSTRINLAWTDNSGDETGFKIERKTTGAFAQIASLGANVIAYANTGLTANTLYTYRIRAYRGGDHSAYSNEASATTPVIPAAPTGLTAAAISSTQINLAWNDNSGNETGFQIERKSGGGSFAFLVNVAANVTSYGNMGLAASTAYTYRVRAYRDTDFSGYSNEASATTLPTAPSSLTATAVSSTRINVGWTDGSSDETGFQLERKSGAGAFAVVASLAAGATTYSNTGLAPDTSYTYRVRAVRNSAFSAYSNEAIAKTVVLPAAPSGLIATAAGSARINLAWTDNSGDETGFQIERKSGGGAFALLATVGTNVATYANTGLAASTAYTYRVRAVRSPDVSAYSNLAAATTPALPAAPSGLTATAGSLRINLAWTDNSSDETGFNVERKSSGGFAVIATVGAGVKTYANNGLTANTQYTYRVRAQRMGDYSAYSNEATASALPVPNVPSGLTAKAVGAGQINLAWRDNSGDETSFQIERKSGSTAYALRATVGRNVVKYSDAGLTASTAYTYRVRAVRNADTSAYSSAATATTFAAPRAPSGLTALAISKNQVDLKWTDNSSDETGFRVERKIGSGAFQVLTILAANSTSVSDIDLAANTTCTYRVSAVRGAEASAYSNEATATTLR